MLITFSTQKGGTGKTTLAIAFANYIALNSKKKVLGYDWDFQMSFYTRWKDDETLELPKLYDVHFVEGGLSETFQEPKFLQGLSESEEVNIVDLSGTLDSKYINLLGISDYIIIPFEYSEISNRSTIAFINFLGSIDTGAGIIFIRSKYEKGFNYPTQELIDMEFSKHGLLVEYPVYKRNCIQNINTRSLPFEQKRAVKHTFKEIISHINYEMDETI